MLDVILKRTMPEPLFVVPLFGAEYVRRIVPLIDAAQEEIMIIIFFWRVGSTKNPSAIGLFNEAIFKAVARGVRVRAIVNSEGVKAVLSARGVETKVLQTSRLLHTKLLIIDRLNIVVGSHNFTEGAFSSNYELSLYLYEQNADNEFITYFEHLW